ncbi:MAG: response regulator [Endomicrobiales bacterium]|jgi:DNA-binding response OmpR family regulator
MAEKIITILVIDDNESILETMSIGLEISGFNVITAADGKSGLARIRQDKPDVIILDIRLPDMDGFQVCKESKSDQQTKDIPVILITGDQTVDIDKGFALGADDCILKPVDMDYLISRIKKLAKIKPKILAMDDDVQICELLSIFLTKQGYDVKCINDGIKIVEIAREFKPKLILLDISLPIGPSGVESCRLLKADPATKNIPVIMVTADEYVEKVDKCFEYGAEDYVFKPFNLPELLLRVKKYAK